MAPLNSDVNHSGGVWKQKGTVCSVWFVSTANTDRYFGTLLFYQGYQGRHKEGYSVLAMSPKRLTAGQDPFSSPD